MCNLIRWSFKVRMSFEKVVVEQKTYKVHIEVDFNFHFLLSHAWIIVPLRDKSLHHVDFLTLDLISCLRYQRFINSRMSHKIRRVHCPSYVLLSAWQNIQRIRSLPFLFYGLKLVHLSGSFIPVSIEMLEWYLFYFTLAPQVMVMIVLIKITSIIIKHDDQHCSLSFSLTVMMIVQNT